MWVLSKEKFSRDIFSNNGIYIIDMLNITFKLGSPTKWDVHKLKTSTIMLHIIYIFFRSLRRAIIMVPGSYVRDKMNREILYTVAMEMAPIW